MVNEYLAVLYISIMFSLILALLIIRVMWEIAEEVTKIENEIEKMKNRSNTGGCDIPHE